MRRSNRSEPIHRIVNRVPPQRQPTTTTGGVEPPLKLDACGVLAKPYTPVLAVLCGERSFGSHLTAELELGVSAPPTLRARDLESHGRVCYLYRPT
jgi:hypothetical protein